MRYQFANVADIGYGTAPNTNPVAIFHATEYPLGTAVPTTFGGKRVSIIEGGGIVTSDPVGITIPVGATFYERCYVAVPFPAKSLAASAVAGGSLSGTYYYRVVSETDAGLSGVQAAVSVSPSGQAVALSWIDGNEILKTRAFHIYRGTASGSEKWIATVAPNALPGTFTPSVTASGTHTFVDTGLPASSVSTPATPYILWGVGLSQTIPNEGIYFQGVAAVDAAPAGLSTVNTPIFSAFNIYGAPLRTGATATPTVGLAGDSIMSGTGDTDTGQGGINRSGFAVRALQDNFVWVNRAKGGETLANFQGSMRDRRMVSLAGCQRIICNYGTNSLGSVSVAAMKSAILDITAAFNAQGSKVHWCTLVPKTTSTDSWASPGNQTPYNSTDGVDTTNNTPELRRVAINTWLRDTSASGYVAQAGGAKKAGQVFDVASKVETNAAGVLTQNGGRWITSGSTANYGTIDGTHPSPTGHGLMATAIATAALAA